MLWLKTARYTGYSNSLLRAYILWIVSIFLGLHNDRKHVAESSIFKNAAETHGKRSIYISRIISNVLKTELWDASCPSWWFSASHQSPLNYAACVRHKVFFFCILGHRTCSQLWSKGRPARPTRTDSSYLTSSCQTSTQLCRLCSVTCRSAAAASIPTCTTMARSASACWAPGLARWVLQVYVMYRYNAKTTCRVVGGPMLIYIIGLKPKPNIIKNYALIS